MNLVSDLLLEFNIIDKTFHQSFNRGTAAILNKSNSKEQNQNLILNTRNLVLNITTTKLYLLMSKENMRNAKYGTHIK